MGPLTSLHSLTRRVILQQAPTHPLYAEAYHRTRRACMCAVSGSFSLPIRGSFRLSLAVLVHYRSLESI